MATSSSRPGKLPTNGALVSASAGPWIGNGEVVSSRLVKLRSCLMLKTRTKRIKLSPHFLTASPSMSQKPKYTGLNRTNPQFHTGEDQIGGKQEMQFTMTE